MLECKDMLDSNLKRTIAECDKRWLDVAGLLKSPIREPGPVSPAICLLTSTGNELSGMPLPLLEDAVTESVRFAKETTRCSSSSS